MHNRIDRLIFGRSIMAAYGEFTEKGPVYMVGVGRVSRAHPDPSVPPARARISNDFENESIAGGQHRAIAYLRGRTLGALSGGRS